MLAIGFEESQCHDRSHLDGLVAGVPLALAHGVLTDHGLEPPLPRVGTILQNRKLNLAKLEIAGVLKKRIEVAQRLVVTDLGLLLAKAAVVADVFQMELEEAKGASAASMERGRRGRTILRLISKKMLRVTDLGNPHRRASC